MNVRFENFTPLSSTQHELVVARNQLLGHELFGPDCVRAEVVNPEVDFTTAVDEGSNKEYRLAVWSSTYGAAINCMLALEANATALRRESYFLVTSVAPETYRTLGVASHAGFEGRSYLSQTDVDGIVPGQEIDGMETMLAFIQAGRQRYQSPPGMPGKLTAGASSGTMHALMRHSMSYEAGIAHNGAAMDFESPNSLTHRLGSAILSQLHREHEGGNDKIRPVGANGMLAGYIVEDTKEGIIFAQRSRRQITISRMHPPRHPDRNAYVEQYRIAPDVTLFDLTPVELCEDEMRDFGVQVAMQHFMHGDQAYYNRLTSEDPAPASELQTNELNRMLMQILSGRMGISNIPTQPK